MKELLNIWAAPGTFWIVTGWGGYTEFLFPALEGTFDMTGLIWTTIWNAQKFRAPPMSVSARPPMSGKFTFRITPPGQNEAAAGDGQSVGQPSSFVKPMVDHALAYARHIAPVFPCKTDKTPLTKHGYKDATTDEAKIKSSWERAPGASIGIATGAGFFVLDVDIPKADGGVDGRVSLAALESQHGQLPETLEAKTGSGGRHLYYRCPPDLDVRNSASLIAPGLDIRGNGGYVIAPPSGHPSGGQYQWVDHEVQIADAPSWLLDKIVKKEPKPDNGRLTPTRSAKKNDNSGYILAALEREHDKVAYASPNTRNETLNTAAFSLGQLVGGGELDRATVEHTLLAAARTCGLPDHEAMKTINSGLSGGIQKPRTVPKPRKRENARKKLENKSGKSQITEDLLATEFVSRHGENWRFCPDFGWYSWDEKSSIWRKNESLGVIHLIREICRSFNPDGKPTLGRAATARGVEVFARADPRLVIMHDQLDGHPEYIGTPAGALHLTDGTISHGKELFITKSTLVPMATIFSAPVW